jgi:quercetin dioxygenase-like cupin family protein
LVEKGRGLPIDTDEFVYASNTTLLLIHLKPRHAHGNPGALQTYPFESHKVEERIICLSGKFGMEWTNGTETTVKSVSLNQGDMAVIPPNTSHRFSADSDAVIFTING